jgi:predicted 3-demethylubiquinone-9 3-methyltransferase (glyoxalase superfamily)
MQKITPFLLLDGKAEEAMNFYTSVFKNSKVVDVARRRCRTRFQRDHRTRR